MAKGYWVGAYRIIRDPQKLAAYGALAGPAVLESGGQFLARGGEVRVFEDGVLERTVIVEFPSFEQAIAAYRSEAYQRALAALGDGVERDIRIVAGVDGPAT